MLERGKHTAEKPRDFSNRTTGSPLAALIRREITQAEYTEWTNAKRVHHGLPPIVPQNRF